jgi:hypothetical protein
MVSLEISDPPDVQPDTAAIREQLERLLKDPAFCTSKRSVQFLKYVVEETLEGSADQIKERTIGVEVFGRSPAYDTNADHIVRTAAIELRKRLAIYYGDESHRSELRMSLVPGSYIPHFSHPNAPVLAEDTAEVSSGISSLIAQSPALSEEATSQKTGAVFPTNRFRKTVWWTALLFGLLMLCGAAGYKWRSVRTPQYLFWKPVLDSPGSVLLAVGDVPNGPPTLPALADVDVPVIHRTASPSVPFADAVTMARVSGVLESLGKKVVFRPESATSFSDLRESPVVLIGAFNNEWSLRMTRHLRYTLALDQEKHLIYIQDAKSPLSRTWSWQTDRPTGHHGEVSSPSLQDYALISRIWNSQTGRVVIVIGGLYTYGTQAAGELLADPQLLQVLSNGLPLEDSHRTLQIVLRTTVTDGIPGPPQVLALSSE